MVKLQWLQINKFRSVKSGTRLTFNPNYNVLLGQNGTGKTTLLNLVAAVVRSNFEELREIDFELQYELSSDTSTATISVQNEHGSPLPDMIRVEPVFSTKIHLESKSSGRAVIEAKGIRGTLLVIDGEPLDPPITLESNIDSQLNLRWLIFALIQKVPTGRPAFLELGQLFSERQMLRFDESLDYFLRFSSAELELVRVEDHVFETRSSGSITPQLLIALVELKKHQWAEDRHALNHDQLPFLQNVIQLLGFESAEAIVDLLESDENQTASRIKLGNLRFLFTHGGGWRISEKLLSYGQKRMLAFMYYLATVSSVAVVDELVNGLHHRWIRACIEALKPRQVFLTSQNPLLLDYLTFDNPEQVRATFILCRWEGEREQARMLWENMSLEAAEDFFDSYKVGFQQVGELLQAKGLW